MHLARLLVASLLAPAAAYSVAARAARRAPRRADARMSSAPPLTIMVNGLPGAMGKEIASVSQQLGGQIEKSATQTQEMLRQMMEAMGGGGAPAARSAAVEIKEPRCSSCGMVGHSKMNPKCANFEKDGGVRPGGCITEGERGVD